MAVDDAEIAHELVDNQNLFSDGEERNNNREVTTSMPSYEVHNDHIHTHSSRGKFVNVTASLRVIRELIDALLNDEFDFERGEISRRRPGENEATTYQNTNGFHEQNVSGHDIAYESEENQQQPMAYEAIPHNSRDRNTRLNVLSSPRRKGRRGRLPISITTRDSSVRSRQSPLDLPVPAKYLRNHHQRQYKSGDSHSSDCRPELSTNNNNNNKNGSFSQKKSTLYEKLEKGCKSDALIHTEVLDEKSSSVKRCKLSQGSVELTKSSLIFMFPPSMERTASMAGHPSGKEKPN